MTAGVNSDHPEYQIVQQKVDHAGKTYMMVRLLNSCLLQETQIRFHQVDTVSNILH